MDVIEPASPPKRMPKVSANADDVSSLNDCDDPSKTTRGHSESPSRLAVTFKNIAMLAALWLLLPLNLTVVAIATVSRWLTKKRLARNRAGEAPVHAYSGETVLISGGKMTKALQLARCFHADGFRVVLCETEKYRFTGHRFSRCVDAFEIVPEPTNPAYADELLRLIHKHGVHFYVPVCSPIASEFDSLARTKLDGQVTVIHPAPDQIKMLDNKYELATAAKAIGLRAPESYLITDPQQVIDFDFSDKMRPFVLKSIPYDSVLRLDLTTLPRPSRQETIEFVARLPISAKHPWVMQEFVPGKEYCTHSTVRDGELRVHCCCESSPFQVNYEHVDEPEIERWVQTFVDHYRLEGQISFDFMRAHDDGQLYVIECNPRTHSAITAFHDHPSLAEGYFGSDTLSQPMTPKPDSRPTYWIYHELWRIVTSLGRPRTVWSRLKIILAGKEAIFDWNDPLPFVMVHHFHIPMLLIDDLKRGRGWVRIDFNIGKLVQLGGD